MAKFSTEEAYSFGWKTIKEHWTTLIPVTMGLFVASGLVSALIRGRQSSLIISDGNVLRSLIGILAGNILSVTVGVIFSAIVIRVCLQYVDGKATDFGSLFKGITPELLLKVILASVLLNIIIGLGFIALIIPGIYLALRYSLVTYVLMDRNTGIAEAFGESGRLTDGVKLQLLIFAIISGAVALLGLVALAVGLVVALPLIAVAFTHVYRQLTKSVGEKPAVEAAPAAAPTA